MAVAVISDLHSNLEALTTVLKDIESQGIKTIYCLGDLIGYGPNPAEVVDLAMDWDVVLMGNHDEAVLREPYGFNPVARAAVTWTRAQLKPGLLSSAAKKRRWDFLTKLKLTHQLDSMFLVHGSPRDPTMEYILRTDCYTFDGEISEKLRDIFSRFEGLCFCGHTHDPGVITERGEFLVPKDFEYVFEPEQGKKYIINDGSVGQPRDRDPRACYVVVEPGPPRRIAWRRVEYDYRTTMDKILAIPELDRRAADRLADGR
jgi:diadenosine tetraphosphatase ApaH/serine/threonine PP2A family protein phosphatase